MGAGYRRERIDRGIKVRSDDIFALASRRDLAYLLLPRLALILGLLAVPLIAAVIGRYWLSVLLITCVIGLLALSWDLMASVGLVSLGHSLFFGVGAYIAGGLSHSLGWGPWATIPIATVGGALLSAVLLFPILRLRGIYFALITLALPLLFMRVIEATKILGGTEGLSSLPPLPRMPWAYYLAMAALLACFFGFRRLVDSDYGLVLRALKDNDRAVMASGINIYLAKAQAVFIAALPATFAGAFLTHYYRIVGLPAFSLEYSILPLTSAIVGGQGTLTGALVGALILVPLSEVLRASGSLRVVIYSVMLVVFTVGLPEGVFSYLRRRYHQFERLVPVEGE